MESILTSIKKLLGIDENDESFDMDIIIHINSVFIILNQMGVGPTTPFSITDDSEVWTDFIAATDTNYECVKSYIYFKVRMMFDPPQSSSVMDAVNKMINELEWRLNFRYETDILSD